MTGRLSIVMATSSASTTSSMRTLFPRSSLLQDGTTDIAIFPSLLAMCDFGSFEGFVLFLLSFLSFVFLLEFGLFV